MSRKTERVSRRWSVVEVPQGNRDSSSTDESSSSGDSIEDSPRIKSTSTPLKSKWPDSKEIHRSLQDRESSEDTQESSSEEQVERQHRHKDHRGRKRYQKEHKRVSDRHKSRHDRRRKAKHGRHSEEAENEDHNESSSSQSSGKHHGEGDMERSRKKKRDRKADDELPITEILRRTQETMRSKYEQQTPFSELTTDKVYVQHRGGFSAVKINRLKECREEKKTRAEENSNVTENQNSPPIRVAIMVQKFWKSTGMVYQGILGGMALMHFIMLHVFFDASMEFVVQHSIICEIYSNMFSFLIALCIVSTFDKFDLARFDIEHLREIYFDCNRAVIAIPLYLIIFSLHQVCSKTDNQFSLVHYYSLNDSLWENATDVQSLLDDLNSWQWMSMSKDILAVLAWLFISLGTKDDAFLIHLQSMEKYTNDMESSGQ